MAADDYAPPTTGTLKLKGVQSSKVSKKKKKKSKPHPDQPKAAKGSATPDPPPAGDDPDPPADAPADANPALPPANRDSAGGASIGKTEAEIRHDEMRRKRLNDRIKREGVKSHKERVEDLNKYLSNLSEHHDMPRIGPG